MGTHGYERLGPVALLGAALCACAPGPAPSAATVPDLFWPPPPAAPKARYLGELPDAPSTPPPRSFLGKAWDVFIGVKEETRESLDPVLGRPFGLATRGDDLFVADPDGHQVLRVQWRLHALTPVRCQGRPWISPMAIAVGPDGALYVADGGANAIIRVALSGECSPLGAGSLKRPTGVAFAAGRIYVVDPPAHDVVAFSPQGSEVLRFGVHGEASGQLNFPTGIAARKDGTLLVVDSLNFRIARFTVEGVFVSSFGEPGDGSGAFGRPKAVTVDDRGRIFVSDAQNDVVVVFGPAGDFDFGIGGSGSGPGQLTLPAGVAVAGDTLFVADSYDHRIEAYQLLGGEP